MEAMEEREAPRIDVARADAQYKPFPDFEQWNGQVERAAVWNLLLEA
jgi:hypothetical protein